MLQTRVIPCLQLVGKSLVKTIRFKEFQYIGDPINTVRIFNELEVDELCFLNIRATVENLSPDLDVLNEIANECFMPLSYGGGVKDFDIAKKIFSIGFEKIIINSYAIENHEFVKKISEHFGSQSVIGSIDVKKNLWGNYNVYKNDGTEKTKLDVLEWAKKLEELGAGELLITSMDNDGTWEGFDINIIRQITSIVNIPVIANGGAGNVKHIGEAVKSGGASAVALGSMVVFQKKGMGVLVNFPDKNILNQILSET
jgi:cyclase